MNTQHEFVTWKVYGAMAIYAIALTLSLFYCASDHGSGIGAAGAIFIVLVLMPIWLPLVLFG